jgi:hypothetical protein
MKTRTLTNSLACVVGSEPHPMENMLTQGPHGKDGGPEHRSLCDSEAAGSRGEGLHPNAKPPILLTEKMVRPPALVRA